MGCCVPPVNWGLGRTIPVFTPLPADAVVRQDIVETLSLNDVILEIEVTPNRPDVFPTGGWRAKLARGWEKNARP
jgi:hypothetical protein